MKISNRVLALVLCIMMLMLTVGCGQEDRASLLPFGLEFGDTYEEVQRANDIGDLKDSNANDGYVSKLKYFSKEDEVIEILGTCEGVSDVAVGLAFNAEKRLYEFYCLFKAENNKVLEINDTIKQKYNKVAGEAEEETDGIALWINEEYSIDYRCTDPIKAFAGEDATYMISIHSFELDFER